MQKARKKELRKRTVFVFQNKAKLDPKNASDPTTYPTTTVTTTDPTVSS